jgi:TPR repeat protein
MNAFSSSLFVRNLALWTFSVLISIKPVYAQTTYPVPSQSAAYPLNTQISPTQIAEFEQIFRFGKFDPKKAIALRTQLQSLADANDPIACYWLAKTYDWFEFGVGQDSDVPIALKWYQKSAELNYESAAYLLYQAYFHEFMGLSKNEIEATKWLNKSKELATGTTKAHILVDFARFSDPNREATAYDSLSTIPRNIDAHLQYLQQAYAIDPHDSWVADYYGSSLYESKRYKEALSVMSNSDNAYTWQQLGQMFEEGKGTPPNMTQALFWYKKMVLEGGKQENDLNPIRLYGKLNIYRLLCLKRITTQQAAPIYSPKDYQESFGRWHYLKCENRHG